MPDWSAVMIAPDDDFDGAPLLRKEFRLDEGHGAPVRGTGGRVRGLLVRAGELVRAGGGLVRLPGGGLHGPHVTGHIGLVPGLHRERLGHANHRPFRYSAGPPSLVRRCG